jgi:hypothetical protein
VEAFKRKKHYIIFDFHSQIWTNPKAFLPVRQTFLANEARRVARQGTPFFQKGCGVSDDEMGIFFRKGSPLLPVFIVSQYWFKD